MNDSIEIRPIQRKNNQQTAKMIRKVLIEQNAPKTGTAYEDKSLDDLYETYKDDRAIYFILIENSKIIGSAGIKAIVGNSEICELQKMYFLPEARNRGLGKLMIEYCMTFAKTKNYKFCYIETLPTMKAAQKLYLKNGFDYIENRLGNTGHHACTIWMLKKL